MDGRERLRDLAVSDTGFVFDPYSGQSWTLNATGRLVLERLKAGDEPEAVEEALRAAFEVGPDEDPGRDVREFILQLRDQGILPKDGGR